MVREIDISKINEAAYNPRVELKPGMPEWEKLRKSIEKFDNIIPLVWNEKTGNLVGGHQRLAVLKHLGRTTAMCSVINVTEAEEKVLNIALNKIKGRWDYDKLKDLLKDFDAQVAEISGFAADEIAVMLASDDDLEVEDDWEEWDEYDDEEFVGGSYVITLVFPNLELARDWAENEGYEDQVKDGKSTTVIRID